jgi:integrase
VTKKRQRELIQAAQDPHLARQQAVEFVAKWLKLGQGIVNKNTLRIYLGYVNEYFDIAEAKVKELGPQHGYKLQHFLQDKLKQVQAKKIKATTYNQCLSAIKTVVRVMFEASKVHKGMDEVQRLAWHDQYRFVTAMHQLKAERGRRVGQWLSKEEIEQMVNGVDRRTVAGQRDLCMLGLIIGAGLRRHEAVAVEVRQLKGDYNGRPMIVGLVGKGGRTDELPVPRWAWELISDWVGKCGGGESSKVLRSVSNKGEIGESMSGEAVRLRFIKIGKDTGVRADNPIRPHDGRRTCGGLIVESGGSIRQAQRQLRHSNITTTASYIGAGLEVRDGQAGVDKTRIKLKKAMKEGVKGTLVRRRTWEKGEKSEVNRLRSRTDDVEVHRFIRKQLLKREKRQKFLKALGHRVW